MRYFIGMSLDTVRFDIASYAISLLTHTGTHTHALRHGHATVWSSTLALSASQIKVTRLICCYVTIPA